LLSVFVNDFYSQIKKLNEARLNPFFSYGYYAQCKKQLTEECWLSVINKSNTDDVDLHHLSVLLESDVDKEILVEGAAYLIGKMAADRKAEYINALYFSKDLRSVSKDIIEITGSHCLLRDLATDKELCLYQMLSLSSEESITLGLYERFPWLETPELLSRDQLLAFFTDLVDEGLLETRVMSLFLMVITPSQLNIICNFASDILSTDDTLCLLMRGGMVKHSPLLNSILAQSDVSSKLIKELRSILGSDLDSIVPFDVQLSAWLGDQGSLECFQQEFALNWPKYEEKFAGFRLLGGLSFSGAIDVANKQSISVSNVLLVTLFERYQSLFLTEKKLGAA
jgi:hypothetical protein